MLKHALAPLLAPRSVALVGASEEPGSLGRTVLENLAAGNFTGTVHAVNPRRNKLLGRSVKASLAQIGEPIDLAIVATPAAAVPGVLEEAKGRLRSAAILTFPEGDTATAKAWKRDVAAVAAKHRIRLLGPGAFGVVRTDLGLNATFCAPIALPGRLALVSQSGAVCTAMLDFAGPLQIGFSTVVSLGGGIDVGYGELLEALLHDPATDGILLYVETVDDARAFMSALRQAARTKPVVVLKAGRSLDKVPPVDALGEPAIAPDVVFDAAFERAGTVRVRTYTQLFAAARILTVGRVPRGNRLAIVSNGHGPGVLAADSTLHTRVRLADLSEPTVRALDALLPHGMPRANPVDVRGDAPPERFADAVAAVIADPAVDAVIALHVPRPVIDAVAAAHAVASVARATTKPLLGAWLGAIHRPPVQVALDAGPVANFYTPENAVDAFSFLAAYRRNQEWLLEVPSSNPDPDPPKLAVAERLRARVERDGATMLSATDARRLLAAFGIATIATRRLQQTLARRVAGACAIVLTSDPVFGPAIAAGASARGIAAPRARAVMLPPLNRRLASDLLAGAAIAPSDALIRLVVQVSAIACALPWVRGLALDPIIVAGDDAHVVAAGVLVDPARKPAPGYGHMAIHPYPVELEGSIKLRDGTTLAVRPVRPEDAELERRFIGDLSDETRYFRFFYRLHELTPAMLGRFTQVDYDRELALLALAPDEEGPGGLAIVGIARYIANLDQRSAEFAVVVADAWHGRGVATSLMKALIARARTRGIERLVGTILRANPNMIRFSRSLGFTIRDDSEDPEQVTAELDLGTQEKTGKRHGGNG